MTDEILAPPEPKVLRFERRNNVMLRVWDNGKTETYEVCKSINAAKRLSITLQKQGFRVVVDKEAKNFIKPTKRHKVVTKEQSRKKTARVGPRLTDEEGKALERHLLRSVKAR